MACDYCTDKDGNCFFPQYGVGPHKHEGMTDDPKSYLGSTVYLPKEEWPDNYKEDEECPGLGAYWCPKCGEGKNSDETKTAGN